MLTREQIEEIQGEAREKGMYALTFPHGLNRQPDYLWLQIKNGVRNE